MFVEWLYQHIATKHQMEAISRKRKKRSDAHLFQRFPEGLYYLESDQPTGRRFITEPLVRWSRSEKNDRKFKFISLHFFSFCLLKWVESFKTRSSFILPELRGISMSIVIRSMVTDRRTPSPRLKLGTRTK